MSNIHNIVSIDSSGAMLWYLAQFSRSSTLTACMQKYYRNILTVTPSMSNGRLSTTHLR